MDEHVDVAVVGAGPFGLSIAAWLGSGARVYGTPMHTWHKLMPPDMLLRSAWSETSLSAPSRAGTIDEWAASTDQARQEPIPLETFLRYADWFRSRFVADHDEADVAAIEATSEGYRIRTTAGGEVNVRAVVLAVGVTPFGHAPPPFADYIGEGVEFATQHQRFDQLHGQRVIVIGAGQAGLETAGLAARAGAEVELLARSEVRWFADREPHYDRGPIGNRLYRFAYPAVGYGPPILNRFVLYPDLFAALPRSIRDRLTHRLLRPGGSPWVRDLLDGKVRVVEGAVVRSMQPHANGFELLLDGGSTRYADRILLATGYRFALDRLSFLDRELQHRIAVEHRWPVLDRWFESSAAGVFFAGYAAEGHFGPLSRFVLGAEFTAPRVAEGVARRVAAPVREATATSR